MDFINQYSFFDFMFKDFKKGMETSGKAGRFDPTMAPMAAMLANDADIADVALFAAGL